jgi:hypothetical protein
MLRDATSFVFTAYDKVRLIPQDLRALPAAFLRSRPKFKVFATYFESVILYRWSFTPPIGLWIKHDPPPVYRRLMNQSTRVRSTLIRMLVVRGK